MTTVHKFPLAAIPDVELMMPAGARLLHVGHQDGALMLWAEVDEQAPAERRQFVVVGTGWGKPADAEVYVGTVQAPNGLVWHVFEVAPLPVPEVGEERQARSDQLRDQAIELDMLRAAVRGLRAECERLRADARRLDALEREAHEPGGLRLHAEAFTESLRIQRGLALQHRSLREAVDQFIEASKS